MCLTAARPSKRPETDARVSRRASVALVSASHAGTHPFQCLSLDLDASECLISLCETVSDKCTLDYASRCPEMVSSNTPRRSKRCVAAVDKHAYPCRLTYNMDRPRTSESTALPLPHADREAYRDASPILSLQSVSPSPCLAAQPARDDTAHAHARCTPH